MKSAQPQIRIGISSCLLGEAVRFDGGHKHDTLITGLFGQFFRWVPVCPEVEAGMGTPRESLRLIGAVEAPRMITARSGVDHSDAMRRYAHRRVEQLASLDLHGYILKKDSPSCGLDRVRVYGGKGPPRRAGQGLFAAALVERLPTLPVEEEGRLRDHVLRENFVERVFARHRWLDLLRRKPRAGDLVDFHTRHKLTLLSHSESHYRRMGRLVASAGTAPIHDLLAQYEREFAAGLAVHATPRKHANVLLHLLGFFKKSLAPPDKQELIDCIDRYRRSLVPLVVPITLLSHHARRHPEPWVMAQTYLHPYPSELMLRNSV
jgi:uncharacterized protein YbgA (DUF1722 family)/uncharacterized protein YbbK (DUF523 family)